MNMELHSDERVPLDSCIILRALNINLYARVRMLIKVSIICAVIVILSDTIHFFRCPNIN
jgi:hypothetical protein